MDPDLFRVALGPIFAPVVTEIPDQFLFLGIDGDHRLLFRQSGGHLAVDVAELRIPVGVAVTLRGLAVALQTVTRLVEQVGDQGATDLVTLCLQRLRQPAHAFAGPPQRRFRVTPCRRLDQRLEIVKQRVVLGDRSPASRSRPPNALRGLVRRQFLQAPSDGARRNPGRHRDRRNPAITRGKRLRCRNQTPAAFIEKRRHRRKPLSNGFDIDHHHNIWYGKSVVNPYLTLSKVDSIISGRALRGCLETRRSAGIRFRPYSSTHASSSTGVFASLRSAVSNPSVNQPVRPPRTFCDATSPQKHSLSGATSIRKAATRSDGNLHR